MNPITTANVNLRPMAVAGQFYPANPAELKEMIEKYLADAKLKAASGAPRIIIAPHAGYVFSGGVAAYAFKALADSHYERAIIIGRSHQAWFAGVAADGHDGWETPLGTLAIDQKFISELTKEAPIVKIDSSPHQSEHSLEMMLPFLIQTLGQDIKIVPLLFGGEDLADARELAEVLQKKIDAKTVVIISSDLSHYPTYQRANKLDRETIKAILTGDANEFEKQIKSIISQAGGKADTLACGEVAISAGLFLAQALSLKPILLKYANSGDYFPESKDRVVGYAAITFNATTSVTSNQELNKAEQQAAIDLARQTIEYAFAGQNYSPPSLPPIFQVRRGAFVTLKNKGQLRGCIGALEAQAPLGETIKEMASSAAFTDPRFSPLQKQELPDIEIEISVLSVMTRINNVGEIEIGKHGVYLRQGGKSGVFLPQVAEEQVWDRETFLNNLCMEKAGLAPDCWRDSATEIYIFTAQVFS